MTYDDPRKYRLSISGFSIKTGWGEDKRIVAAYPGKTSPLNQAMYLQWLSDAESICERHNAALMGLAATDSENDNDCPFTYRDGEEPPRPEHPELGVCVYCFGPAYIKCPADQMLVSCFPCAISAAS